MCVHAGCVNEAARALVGREGSRTESDLLEQVEATIRIMAEREGRAFSARLADATVVGDRTRIRQILLNLLSNALKFCDGAVRLEVARHEDRICFDVLDDGGGIPVDLAPRLFEPFARGHADKPGTGLARFRLVLPVAA